MKNSSLVKQNMWLVLFIAVCVVAGLEGNAESTNTAISLNPSGQQLERILVTKSSDVYLSNDSVSTLYDFTVIQVSTGKRVVSINDIKPSASFNIAFDRAGTYVACYLNKNKKALSKNTCLQIDVVGLRSI
jgi:hypothetical protein